MSTPIRLQEYGVGMFTGIETKSSLKKALKKGLITVNGKLATSATFIAGGETIIYTPSEDGLQKKLLKLELEVIFEDDYLAVINKPAGITVSGNRFKTIANALSQNLIPSTLSDATKPQPVHRLDYPTTGALLIGKTAAAIRALNKMFEDKKVIKTYYAVTIGEMEPEGEIDTVIDGKRAHSLYEVRETVKSERFEFLNLVKLSPSTGRRHQLRKHMTGIGHPILGDKQYGIEGLILNGKGLYLHAHSLSFEHPFTRQMIIQESILPNRYVKLFGSDKAGEALVPH